MILHVLAVDYDGTIAECGRVRAATAAALARVRQSGRRCVLVTGRRLPDLYAVCPDADAMFDVVVAENGALLYLPARRELTPLGAAPEAALVEGLRRRGVRFDLGASIVATDAEFAEAARAAIAESGAERSLVFNKSNLMLLPGGVTKATGLTAALEAMELSPHNVAGIGDAENDHAFLSLCECAVAVADAVPALREQADVVTSGGAGDGVVEFVNEQLLADGAGLVPAIERHRLLLGRTVAGERVTLPAHATGLLIVGRSASRRSTLTSVLVERLLESGRTFCLVDPEGDHGALAALPGVERLGGGARALPAADELGPLLRRPTARIVLSLGGLSGAERVTYAGDVLRAVAAGRRANGLPHWLILDEAHDIAPPGGQPAAALGPPTAESLALAAPSVDKLGPEARRAVTTVASADLGAFGAALHTLIADGGMPGVQPDGTGGALERGEAMLASLTSRACVRFRVARREVPHRHHGCQCAEEELSPDQSFYFRGSRGALSLRAASLKRFCELATRVDEGTWSHHLRRGEYSRWIRETIEDVQLADEIASLERHDGSPRAVLEAVRRRYAV